jgi:hypothetical protein
MNEQDQNDVRLALKEVLAPVDLELRRDLWPAMLHKLDTREPPVAWYDWALVGLAGAAIAAFPNLILVVVYHL